MNERLAVIVDARTLDALGITVDELVDPGARIRPALVRLADCSVDQVHIRDRGVLAEDFREDDPNTRPPCPRASRCAGRFPCGDPVTRPPTCS